LGISLPSCTANPDNNYDNDDDSQCDKILGDVKVHWLPPLFLCLFGYSLDAVFSPAFLAVPTHAFSHVPQFEAP